MTSIHPGDAAAEPTVKDLVLEVRWYVMRVAVTTPSDAKIFWSGNFMRFSTVHLSISELTVMVLGLVSDLLLLHLQLTEAAGEDLDAMPLIKWQTVEDNIPEDKIEHDLLSDTSNKWSCAGNRWDFNKVVASE